jgi:2-polyprenyl-3-methyl-5-hydroxy-6-metoxy-1,4-benzoquinol methylase
MLISEQEFINYFGKSKSEYSKLYNTGDEFCSIRRNEFNKIVNDINNKEQLFSYYNSEVFITELIACFPNDETNIKELINNSSLIFNLDKLFFYRKKLNILDYGCGSFYLSLIYAFKNHNVDSYDLPHKFFNFITKFKDNCRINPKPIINEDKLCLSNNYYDLVICNEVLEHCPEPVIILKQLIKSLKAGGFCYLSVFFNDMNGHDPSHLVSNTQRYDHCQTWNNIVMNEGLIPIAYNEGGSLKVWQKPYNYNYIIDNNKQLEKYINTNT